MRRKSAQRLKVPERMPAWTVIREELEESLASGASRREHLELVQEYRRKIRLYRRHAQRLQEQRK